MDRYQTSGSRAAESLQPRPQRLIRRLAWLYGGTAAAVLLLLAAAALPASVLPQARALARECLEGGLAALVLAPLLLALTALFATLVLAVARARHAAAGAPELAGRTRWSLADPGFAARQAQALIVSAGTLLIWLLVRLLWPRTGLAPQPMTANIAAAFVFAAAFVSLMAERVMNEFPAAQLPEAPLLRRVLLLVTVLLLAAACTEIGRSVRISWIRWPQLVLLWIPALVALELVLRALGRLFLPPPAPEQARAVADSVLAALITGGPRAPGVLLRRHFGLDFARSWALAFLSAAILPALFGTALLCWALSGLKLIDLSHRGVYERFGAPVAVYGPGLHLLLPWPFGRLRLVEYGTIHSVAIGVGAADQEQAAPVSHAALAAVPDAQVNAALQKLAQEDLVTVAQLPYVFAAEGLDYTHYREQLREQLARAQAGQQAAQPQAAAVQISAEATPPPSLNRLWSTVHADQAHYLVASQGTGVQGFQSVDTEIYVLYRVGLNDQAALRSIYTVANPAALVRETASRLVLRYFNSQTLDDVIGLDQAHSTNREGVAAMLRRELTASLASYHAGIDVVSVLIEEIHPPSGAAAAYHAVQAARINANASIADELGRAQRTAGVAHQEAHELVAAATAAATETGDTANAEAYRFAADQRAYAAGGHSFVLERLYTGLLTALKGKPLVLMDNRLDQSDGPLIDMRPIAMGQDKGSSAGPPAPAPAPAFQMDSAFTNAD
jgi:regulator of protease activity HflC (stomatin/prohibitin superfamily)